MPEFSIPIHDLDAGGRDYRFPVRPAWVLGALEGTNVTPGDEDGQVELRLSKSATDVVVRGRLHAALRVPCARCLEPAKVPVDVELSALAVVGDPAAGDDEGEQEVTSQEADMIPYDGETVVLDDMIRDEILLGIPMIPLCSESCPGISPHPGRDDGEAVRIDPRLRPLLKLKKT
jgi:uncharacterized protein